MRVKHLIMLFAATLGVSMAADSPFIGKWKLNPAKSQFAGTTMTYEMLPSGEMQMTAEGQSYKFKIDGKEYPAFWGATATWKQVDPTSWETTVKMGGMKTTETTKISADGKTMTAISSGKKPNGENLEMNATWVRVSGGPGLVGKWKSTKVQASTEMWEITANGDDGLTMKIVDYNAVCSVKFDGKDYPCTGPTMPKNFSMAAKKTGVRSVEFTEKMDGKVAYKDLFTVSSDGKTITDEAAPAGSSERIKVVYDKQ
ncbi:MAG TPA: hypothetical protein VKU19_43025 [Bryobacteraceae bacterium]|nr:hypothetical protein [Bryobacteraceae bacterium]